MQANTFLGSQDLEVTKTFECAQEIKFIEDPSEVPEILRRVSSSTAVGFDCETTGFDPHSGKVRLMQFGLEDIVYVIDLFKVNPILLKPIFEDASTLLIGHNLKFDLKFAMSVGLNVASGRRLFDTMLSSQILWSGTSFGYIRGSALDDLFARYEGLSLDKSEQKSNWSGELTEKQKRYAGNDVGGIISLARKINTEIKNNGLARVHALEMRALPAYAWIEYMGVGFDSDAWKTLYEAADKRRIELEYEMGKFTNTLDMFDYPYVNWSSWQQVQKIFKQRGIDVESTNETILAGLAAEGDQLARMLLEHRELGKKVGTYGVDFLKHVCKKCGNIHGDFIQIGAASGRNSCNNPNLQQIPRDKAYRRCFKPAESRAFIKSDFSQIELRLAAEQANEARMIEAYMNQEDLHTLTAMQVLGKKTVSPEDRQTAKSLNFGLLYGMGAEKLQKYAATNYSVYMTLAEAETFRNKFFKTYPGLQKWHREQKDGTCVIWTTGGRRRLDVSKFTEKVNTPVQGAGADGFKHAVALLWETHSEHTGHPVLFVHDEIVLDSPIKDIEANTAWVEECMIGGMKNILKRVPVEVEAHASLDWAGTPVDSGKTSH